MDRLHLRGQFLATSVGNDFLMVGNDFPMVGSHFPMVGSHFLMVGDNFLVVGNDFLVVGDHYSARCNECPRANIYFATTYLLHNSLLNCTNKSLAGNTE